MTLAKLAVAGFLAGMIYSTPGWGQTIRANPFALPAGVQFKNQGEEAPLDLVLQAIVVGRARRVATINDRNYGINDRVNGLRIMEIQEDRVILQAGPGRRELRLNRPPFSIRVTPPGARPPNR